MIEKAKLVNGLVKRFERGDMIVDLGTNLEAILPRREQARGETWNINERLRVVIADVSKESRGQQVIVSRASADLLKRLFEMEVPRDLRRNCNYKVCRKRAWRPGKDCSYVK